jgi:pyruvate,orthophosphate dikinase
MRWIHPLSPEVEEPADVLGGKAHGLVVLRRLGLPVPPGFVIGTEACRAFLRHGRLPDGLDGQLAAAVADLEAATNRKLGGPERPLAVSVRSGASASMPGMMTTVLNLGLTRQTAIARLRLAVAAVFSSWDTPRATTYRELHDIPHDLGTAVTVQAMVFGNRDDHSGAGVAFSRDPNTGEPVPFGEVLFGRRGDEVVSGRSLTRPLHDLAGREPTVWAGLLEALHRVEEHDRDACCLEFTSRPASCGCCRSAREDSSAGPLSGSPPTSPTRA